MTVGRQNSLSWGSGIGSHLIGLVGGDGEQDRTKRHGGIIKNCLVVFYVLDKYNIVLKYSSYANITLHNILIIILFKWFLTTYI